MTILPSRSRRSLPLTASLVLLLLAGSARATFAQVLYNEVKLVPDSAPIPFSGEGTSVAISGTTAVVGAPYGSAGNEVGSAHVFVLSGSVWKSEATLVPGDPVPFDSFGMSVAIQADTILVAAPYTTAAPSGYGAVYVFQRSGGVWSQVAKLTGDYGAHTYFGVSIALDGNTAVVGDSANDDAGRLAVFSRINGVWNTNPVTVVSVNPENGSQFGHSVAIQGNIIVTGAPNDTVFNSHIGTVQIFKRINNAWTAFGALITNDLSDGDALGMSVAIEGQLIIVGASGQSKGAGAAYVFHQQADGTWTSLPQFWTKLLPKSPQSEDFFGWSVSISNAVVLVGANGKDGGRGAVYGYNDLTGTSNGTKNVASDGMANDVYGWSAAIDGDRAVVGAPIKEPSGVAYAYDVKTPLVFQKINWVFTLWPYKYIYMGCPLDLIANGAATITMDSGRLPLSFSIGREPRHGSLRFVDATTLEYRPAKGFTGRDIFTVRVTDEAGQVLEKTANVTVVAAKR